MIARVLRRPCWPLAALIAVYTFAYSLLCWARFSSFHAQIDFSYYLRLAWGLGHGFYDLPLVQARHVLGLHLEPIVLPLALLGRLGIALPPLLIVSQALCVALSAWPAYRIAARHLGPPHLPTVVAGMTGALLALLYPTVTVATLHDFHPVTLALAPLLALLDTLDEAEQSAPSPAALRRLRRRAVLWGALSLACREDIALQLACVLAAYTLLRRWPVLMTPASADAPAIWRGRAVAATICLALFAYCFIYLLWIQPRYVPAQGSYNLHFAKVGAAVGGEVHSSRDLVLLALRHPVRVIVALLDRERILYPILLLWPVAGLALLAPRALAGTLPVLAINFLSGFPRVLRLESHYTTALVPFIVAAGLVGAGRALRITARRDTLASQPGPSPRPSGAAIWVIASLLCGALSAHGYHGGSPLSLWGDRFAWPLFRDPDDAPALRRLIAAVPPAASIAARPGPLAHLAQRPRAISPPEYDDGQPVDVVLPPVVLPSPRR